MCLNKFTIENDITEILTKELNVKVNKDYSKDIFKSAGSNAINILYLLITLKDKYNITINQSLFQKNIPISIDLLSNYILENTTYTII